MIRILGNSTTILAATALSAAVLVAACGGSSGDSVSIEQATANDLVVKSISSPPQFVTGGAALLQIALPAGTTGSNASVTVNGKPASVTLAAGPQPGMLIGVVQGLPDGTSQVTVNATDAQGNAHMGNLSVTSTTRTSSVIVPPVTPLICRTVASGLGAPTDADCNAPVQYTYLYRSTDPTKTALQPYDPAHPASDVAQTTTDAGVTQPFIVRNERGVIDH
ncbi:hypothetical protein HGR00_04240 [Ralstonia insidiosa]|uniref:DUF6351 domain-containing protein n=1 Tax=Ralstonia insidiosa TaxID=190721 RepID=A0A848NX93_9RALS|nr:hypothetical protein [Ralstonia insidiosa]